MKKTEFDKPNESASKGLVCPHCGGPVGAETMPGLNGCAYCGGTFYVEPVRLPAAPIERPVSLKAARSMHRKEDYGLMRMHIVDIAEGVHGKKTYGDKREKGNPGGVEFLEGMLAAFNRTTELDVNDERDEAFWNQMAQVPPREDGQTRSERFRAGYLEGLAYVLALHEWGSDDDNFYYGIGSFSRILSGADD